MRVHIDMQDGTRRTFHATWGKNYLCNSFGVHLFQEEGDTFSAVFSNGWVGGDSAIGGFFFAMIWLELDGPERPYIHGRIGHVVQWGDGIEAVGFGTGADYFPPRAVHVIRWARSEAAKARIYNRPMRRGSSTFVCAPKALAFHGAKHDAYADELLTCLRTGVGNQNRDVWTGHLGYLHPIGITRGDRPGGEGLDATPGWQHSSRYHLVSMDMRMDRTPLAWIDKNTGEPILQQRPEYHGTRTWNKSGVLSEFVMPRSMSQYEDYRIPRDVNSGNCTYRWALVPMQKADGTWTYPYEADDCQHLVRATAHLKACRDLYRDKAAALCLRMAAADAWAAWKPRAVARGAGLPGVLRSTGWTLDALTAAGYKDQAALIVRNLNAAQMLNGFWQNWSSADFQAAGGGSPNPWVSGMNPTLNAAQGKENAYTALAMAQAGGQVPQAAAALRGMYGDHYDPDIWQAVAQGASTFPTPRNASNVGKDHHQHWGALGVLARLDKSWLRTAMKLVPPDGPGPLGPNMIAVLAANPYPEGVACLIEACERWQ